MGSIFVEFAGIKNAETAINKVKGRIYDGREIKAFFIPEDVYLCDFFPMRNTHEIADL